MEQSAAQRAHSRSLGRGYALFLDQVEFMTDSLKVANEFTASGFHLLASDNGFASMDGKDRQALVVDLSMAVQAGHRVPVSTAVNLQIELFVDSFVRGERLGSPPEPAGPRPTHIEWAIPSPERPPLPSYAGATGTDGQLLADRCLDRLPPALAPSAEFKDGRGRKVRPGCGRRIGYVAGRRRCCTRRTAPTHHLLASLGSTCRRRGQSARRSCRPRAPGAGSSPTSCTAACAWSSSTARGAKRR